MKIKHQIQLQQEKDENNFKIFIKLSIFDTKDEFTEMN